MTTVILPKLFGANYSTLDMPRGLVVTDYAAIGGRSIKANYIFNNPRKIVNDLCGNAGSLDTSSVTFDGKGIHFDNTQGALVTSPITFNDPGVGSAGTFWSTNGTYEAVRIRCTLDADAGGPLVLFEKGGSTNGYSLVYLTGPDTIAFDVADGGTKTTITSTSTYAPDQDLDVIAIFDDGDMSLIINGIIEATTTASHSAIADGTSDPGLGGVGAISVDYARNQSGPDEWGGYVSVLQLFGKLSTAEALEIQRRPFDLFKPSIPIHLFLASVGGAFTLTADSGSYTYNGTASSLLLSALVGADSGSYSYSGSSAALDYGYYLASDSGSYSYSGANADILLSASLSVATGAYSYSGTASSLNLGLYLAGESGSYVYSGTDATLTFTPAGNFTLTSDSGGYAYSGASADLLFDASMAGGSGSYAYSGTSADLNLDRYLSADSGAYTYSGSAAQLITASVISAATGTYEYTGSIVTLSVFTGQIGSGYGAGSSITNYGIGLTGVISNYGRGESGEILLGFGASAAMKNSGIGKTGDIANDGLGENGEI